MRGISVDLKYLVITLTASSYQTDQAVYSFFTTTVGNTDLTLFTLSVIINYAR